MPFMTLNNPPSENDKINIIIQLLYSPIYTIEIPQSILDDIEDLAMDYTMKFSNRPLKEFFNEVRTVRNASFKNLSPYVFDTAAKETGKFEVCMRLFTNEYESFTTSDVNIPVENFPKSFTPKWDKIQILKEIINEIPELLDEIHMTYNFYKLNNFT